MIWRHHRSMVRCRDQRGTRQMLSLGSGWPWRSRMRAAARLARVLALPGKRILRTIVQTSVEQACDAMITLTAVRNLAIGDDRYLQERRCST